MVGSLSILFSKVFDFLQAHFQVHGEIIIQPLKELQRATRTIQTLSFEAKGSKRTMITTKILTRKAVHGALLVPRSRLSSIIRQMDAHFGWWPYEAAAIAFEAIPRTLAQNCGVNVIRTITSLQRKMLMVRTRGLALMVISWGSHRDMKGNMIRDAYNVKAQTFKTAIEAACMLLRIDDIVSGIKKKQPPGASQMASQPESSMHIHRIPDKPESSISNHMVRNYAEISSAKERVDDLDENCPLMEWVRMVGNLYKILCQGRLYLIYQKIYPICKGLTIYQIQQRLQEVMTGLEVKQINLCN
ncbi:hypothetical protein IFM89_035955 [Coptis chinensis]|uniref:Uncharacterized protein n=1 Tax=Coptis chinensis TaxID=261450 RepID=A0A835H2V5_9MAGN|nr:hypothetical protein IFM89_035955 [Coptis chinensis]